MGAVKKAWKKLAVRFPTDGRKGNEDLAKADYVEYEQFAPTAEGLGDEPPQGYFCASCVYYKAIEGGQFGGICKELNSADVERFGCCNKWQIIPKMDESQHKSE